MYKPDGNGSFVPMYRELTDQLGKDILEKEYQDGDFFCTLKQFLITRAEALGYKWEVYHVKCNKSGTGHVYGRFKKSGDWFVRDIACIADESRYCVWCEAGNGGTLIAKNPVWFLQNLRR